MITLVDPLGLGSATESRPALLFLTSNAYWLRAIGIAMVGA